MKPAATTSIDKKLFLLLAAAFILTTVVGTITHELGHFIIAKILGYDAEINYATTFHSAESPNHHFLIRLGGPIQTMLTGTIGLLLIYFSRNRFFTAIQLSFRQWVLVFISLFWLRQTANLFVYFLQYMVRGYFPASQDEIKIADYLLLPQWSLLFITASIGLAVLLVIIFKIIPVKQQLTFISAGCIGSITGYVLWLHIVGPMIMP